MKRGVPLQEHPFFLRLLPARLEDGVERFARQLYKDPAHFGIADIAARKQAKLDGRAVRLLEEQMSLRLRLVKALMLLLGKLH